MDGPIPHAHPRPSLELRQGCCVAGPRAVAPCIKAHTHTNPVMRSCGLLRGGRWMALIRTPRPPSGMRQSNGA